MAIIDRIKYDGPTGGAPWLVYKCPSDKYVLGSQLIVNQGQEAIFFSGGEALDVFGPGTHTLKSGNLPLLNALVDLPFGGKTPFTAEVYFVNKTASLDLKWGTSTPIPLEDPKYKIILNVGARGQYGITIDDSRMFVTRVIGAVPGGTVNNQVRVLKYFNGLINMHVKTVVSQQLIKKGLSFLEVSQFLPEISSVLQEKVSSEFARYGIKVMSLFCESIAPGQQEYAKLRQYKEELALGSEFYQQRRSFDIMEKLADNQSSGGMANAGIGIGMGLGALQQFGGVFAGVGQNMSKGNTNTVSCPKCGTQNPQASRFCSACGTALGLRRCPTCSADVPAGSKFCNNCGTPL